MKVRDLIAVLRELSPDQTVVFGPDNSDDWKAITGVRVQKMIEFNTKAEKYGKPFEAVVLRSTFKASHRMGYMPRYRHANYAVRHIKLEA